MMASIQILIEEVEALVFEKDELERRDKSELINFRYSFPIKIPM